MRSRPLGLALLLLAACQSPPSPGSQTAQTSPQALEVEQERWLKSTAQSPRQVDQRVDWEAAQAAHQRLDLAPALAGELDKVPAPVLLPAQARWRQEAQLTQGPGWHALALRGDGLHLSLHASTRAVQRPDILAELGKDGLGDGPHVSQSHQIWSVSFRRFGVSYLLDVECLQPDKDPRCADDAQALTIYRDLVVAGGAP
jgi:hypothetical protein